jgi:hypothetical protein
MLQLHTIIYRLVVLMRAELRQDLLLLDVDAPRYLVEGATVLLLVIK